MTVFSTILSLIAGLLVLILAFMTVQYRKFQKMNPRPPFKPTTHKPEHEKWSDDEVSVAWIGHSTLYINLFGFKIITDPVFSEKVGVGLGKMIIGPKRHTEVALTHEEMGDVDLVLLSHAHLDHFDLPSLRRLASPDTQVVTARNISRLLKRFRYGKVQEVGGTDSITLDNGAKITAVPVRHWGRRFPWNKDYGWTGYLIEYKGVRLFFAGDTAYTPTFKDLQKIGPIDITFMPIGAYSPDSFQGSHCTPEQAWQMFLDSGAKWLVPIHWDTFVLSREPVTEPMERLLAVAGDEQNRIVIREHGQSFMLPSAVQTRTS
jgi:L-ascorbate metabolism protein UlaG (beta-lactamase superfamily)